MSAVETRRDATFRLLECVLICPYYTAHTGPLLLTVYIKGLITRVIPKLNQV